MLVMRLSVSSAFDLVVGVAREIVGKIEELERIEKEGGKVDDFRNLLIELRDLVSKFSLGLTTLAMAANIEGNIVKDLAITDMIDAINEMLSDTLPDMTLRLLKVSEDIREYDEPTIVKNLASKVIVKGKIYAVKPILNLLIAMHKNIK